jgi:hypothetical protein
VWLREPNLFRLVAQIRIEFSMLDDAYPRWKVVP